MLILSHLAGHFVWSLRVKLIFDPPQMITNARSNSVFLIGQVWDHGLTDTINDINVWIIVDLDPALGIQTRTDVRRLENT